MSETLLSVIQILMISVALGFIPLMAIESKACTPRELIIYPVLVFRSLRKSYNRVGSAILTVVSLLVYPTALSGVAIYSITVGIVRAFNWAFKNRE